MIMMFSGLLLSIAHTRRLPHLSLAACLIQSPQEEDERKDGWMDGRLSFETMMMMIHSRGWAA